MYNKVSTNLNFVEREKAIGQFWKEHEISNKCITNREGCPQFTVYDGPPTANGMPHIGHIITRAVKDIIPRYKTMKGFKVFRKAGWDTHGLPVELEVEKQLGISGKPQIENHGVESFIQKCKESVWKYEREWREMSDRVGFWADMDNPYVTYKNDYIESEWWALKKIWDKGLLYKGHKVVPYCPRCGTALSSHEVSQGYKDVKEFSVYVKFKVKGKENEYILAWTTTPWTLPSNVALIVNANITYGRYALGDEVYIIADSLAPAVLGEGYETIETFQGSMLQGMRYAPPFDFLKEDEVCFFVVTDDYVTLTEGTGVVHTAPAFGEDDARVCQKYKLPFRQYVDTQGNFTKEVTPWEGMFVKKGDAFVIEYLKEHESLFRVQPFEHSYPFCWRCDTPLLYYARDTWFIAMTKVRDALVANNRTVNWLPDNIKEGRFGNFLENVVDWGLSRERYWGTPLPIWECDCGHQHVIGSIKELRDMSNDCPEEIELHKPFIDRVHLKCPVCGGTMTRVPEVIDCWFDSGSMPFAQHHYPFENKDIFDKLYPADFISEAVDQTRGWFYTLMAISTLVFDKSPFKNCIVIGHVQDKNGQKMSKHTGNVVDPWKVLNKQGADAVRWYFFTNSAPWLPSRFSDEVVSEGQRKFMGTLWNTYAFYVLYANIDNFNPMAYELEYDKLEAMDKWVLSKLQTLIKMVDENLENYRVTEPARALQDFVDGLSNWYVRRNRERFWSREMTQDKINAYMTLYTVLSTVIKIAAPFIPFITEEIYQNIVRSIASTAPESIHLCDFPVAKESWIDKELETNMDFVLGIVLLGRSARNTANIKNRQPIGQIFVRGESTLSESYVSIVSEELNVKKVIFIDDVAGFTSYKFKPQLKTLGPKYGKLVPKIGSFLNNSDGSVLMEELKASGKMQFKLEDSYVVLSEEDLLIETSQKDGFITEENQKLTAIIDTNLTPELIEEGFVREIVSKIQSMRKEANFEVMDHIDVYHTGSNIIEDVIERNADTIKTDVLAENLVAGISYNAEGSSLMKEWSINGESIILTVIKK